MPSKKSASKPSIVVRKRRQATPRRKAIPALSTFRVFTRLWKAHKGGRVGMKLPKQSVELIAKQLKAEDPEFRNLATEQIALALLAFEQFKSDDNPYRAREFIAGYQMKKNVNEGEQK
jgi:hypothetical protein